MTSLVQPVRNQILAMSTSFHHQADGQTEHINWILEEMLRSYVSYKQDNWDEYLTAAEFAYNNSKQASIGFTPFELDAGQHPITPPTLTSNKVSNIVAADEFLDHWNNLMKITKDALLLAQQRQSVKNRRHVEFNVGDHVTYLLGIFILLLIKVDLLQKNYCQSL